MNKIRINMLSKANQVKGQGVGSAYIEQVRLVKQIDSLEIEVNSPRSDFDIYHVHSVQPELGARMSKKHINVMYVHFLPDTLNGSIRLPKFLFKLFKKYVMSIYFKADEIVVVNPTYIEPLVNLGIKKENITYIPNYVDPVDFHELSKDEIKKIRDEYKIEQNAFVVMGCGQLQNRKGVQDFVEVAKRNPDITFVWAGGFSFKQLTDGYEEIKQIVENHPNNVKFLGIVEREKMNAIYNMSDMLFMPSFSELFPMSILEACNAKKPVLLRNLELYEEILFKNQNCYLSADDVEGFSKEIKALKDDKEKYQIAQKGCSIISDYYSKERVKKLWDDYYHRIYEKWKNNKKLQIK